MGKQSIVNRVIQKDVTVLGELEYDYKLLMQLLRAPKSSRLYARAHELKYFVDERRDLNLELELRRIVIEEIIH